MHRGATVNVHQTPSWRLWQRKIQEAVPLVHLLLLLLGVIRAPLDEMHWKSLNWVAHELNPPSVRRRREFCKLTLVYSSAVVEGDEWNKRELHTGG